MTYTLPCGLRIICMPSNSDVTYCGYLIMAGTRHEDAADVGMAHFIEHMAFKGTERRRACHINGRLERVGGDLNAFTTKQETVLYATVLKDDFQRAAELLTDITFHSVFPQHEIDKEVEVICDEIDSYKDSPAELIFDDFEALMFPSQPLGRDILGRAERLRQYRTADALRFTEKYYRPDNCIFYVVGDLKPEKVVRLLSKLLSDQPNALPRFVAPKEETVDESVLFRLQGAVETRKKDTHQAHVMMGARTFGGTHRDRFAALLLNNLLGGPGMNSRLNLALREKRGLVYSADSYLQTYPDAGYWNLYFGCDTADVDRCRRIVHQELRRLIDAPLSPAQLAAAKKQLCGQIGIAADNKEAAAHALAKTFAHYNVERNTLALRHQLMNVTAEDIQALAARIYAPEKLTTLIYN